jgi:hypothetical protein
MSSKQSSSTKSDPWAPAQAGLKNTLQTANDWQTSQGDRPLFAGSSVQGFDPAQTQALQGINQRATDGSPLVDQSKDYTSRVMNGDYLNSNPEFGALKDSITAGVMPGMNATFSGAGRTGSDTHAYSLGKALSDSMAPLAFQNYQRERGMQDQASHFAPQLANQDYYDLDRQFAAGGAQQGQSQAELSDQISKYYQEQQRPLTAAQQASSLINPIAGMGGTSQTTQQTSANPLTSILGGAMMGYSALNPAAGGVMGMLGGQQQAQAGSGYQAPRTYVPAPSYTSFGSMSAY